MEPRRLIISTWLQLISFMVDPVVCACGLEEEATAWVVVALRLGLLGVQCLPLLVEEQLVAVDHVGELCGALTTEGFTWG